jgi:molybdopterin synthase catalytic subunit
VLSVVGEAARAGVHEKGTFSLLDGLASVKRVRDFDRAGAVAVFIGIVRAVTAKGGKVEKLVLEAYEEKADEVLRGICDDLRKRPGIVDVQIHHLLGEFKVGEDLVYVLVAGSHRGSVFPVLEEAVERYKREAPIFKKELMTTGRGERKGRWVSEGTEA